MRSTYVKILLPLLVIGGAFFFFARQRTESNSSAITNPTPVLNAGITTSSPPATKKSVERIKKVYQEESQRIGQVDSNPALTEKRLSDVASGLSQEECVYLRDQALDERAQADGRFFATYLLALSAKPEAFGSLRDIALAEIPASKNQGVIELERQIRAQAIEGLSRMRDNLSARDALLDRIEKSDEFLRDRAHRGLYAWQTGKPIEEQDKEALDKVLYKKKN